MNPEQLVLVPHRVFREVELAPPASIRRLCTGAKPTPRRKREWPPSRWIPGTQPIYRLPQAGTDLSRRHRGGKKPGSIGVGKLTNRVEQRRYQVWVLATSGPAPLPRLYTKDEAEREGAALQDGGHGFVVVKLKSGRLSERDELRLLAWELGAEGARFGPPATLGSCPPGPCGHVSCTFNLYVDVIPPRADARCPGAGTPTEKSKLSGATICPMCTGFFPALQPGATSPEHAPAPVIKLNFPGKEIDEIPETCAVRVANRVAQRALDAAAAALEDGGDEPAVVSEKREVLTLEEVGRLLNLTMGRADQLEKRAVRKLADAADAAGWGEAWRGILART